MLPAIALSLVLLAQDAAVAPTQSPNQAPTASTVSVPAPVPAPAPATAVPKPASQAAVSVDAYHRDYERPKGAQEMRFDSGIWQAYNSKESQVGNLEGSWVVSNTAGKKLVGLELRSEGVVSGKLEGAWRSMLAGFGLNDSGFVTDVSLTGRDLEIDYFANSAHSPTILHLHKGEDGQWRGNMLDTVGHKTSIVLSRVDPAG